MSLFVTTRRQQWAWIDPQQGITQQGSWQALFQAVQTRQEQVLVLVATSQDEPAWQHAIRQLAAHLAQQGWTVVIPHSQQELAQQSQPGRVWVLPPPWFARKGQAIRRRLARRQRWGSP
ncbi:MAG: hypothetical protein IMW90_12315 [Thermogemmatispora sp.]|jgi:hypothetical protein|uniref:hypothetical protein n=1 Tax=Thermogemmatispora sp. TaxID=1968838 RepID=UPI0019F19840|nr:hypothetical protein [Thermogemmatispora sp.]MBE3566499.1 hypothetical protein [Thermogemmatispora sp.]